MLELAGSQLAEKCTDFEYEFPKTFFLGTQRRSGRPTELRSAWMGTPSPEATPNFSAVVAPRSGATWQSFTVGPAPGNQQSLLIEIPDH